MFQGKSAEQITRGSVLVSVSPVHLGESLSPAKQVIFKNAKCTINSQRAKAQLLFYSTSAECTLLRASFFEKLPDMVFTRPLPTPLIIWFPLTCFRLLTSSWSCQQGAPHRSGQGTISPHWAASPWGFCSLSGFGYDLHSGDSPQISRGSRSTFPNSLL